MRHMDDHGAPFQRQPSPNLPPPHQQWPAQPFGAPWPPPQRPRRRWGLIAGIAAAVIVVALAVAGGVIATTRSVRQAEPVASPTVPATSASSAAPTTRTAAQAQDLTCQSIKLSIAAVGATPALPKGWTKDTPNIEALMGATRQGMIDAKKYIIVEPGTPENVAALVRAYADAQQALIDHAYVTTPFSELMQYTTRADTASAVAQAAACGK